ncbi:MAG TPA: hypothetical protein VKG25_27165 [Bryobacteraceae bacterium]|nr:hypothetical protein [Bryobacteraceae bacterium]
MAGDARRVTGILDAIVDLALIGDHAYEIVTLRSAMEGSPPSQVLEHMVALGAKVQECLSAAVDSWRTLDRAQALSVRLRAVLIRAECVALRAELSQLVPAPGDATTYVYLMQFASFWNALCSIPRVWGSGSRAAPSVLEHGKAEQLVRS